MSKRTFEQLIADYEKNRAKIQVVLDLARHSRKFGYPMICHLSMAEDVRLLWAKQLLLSMSDDPLESGPKDYEEFISEIKEHEGLLADDARILLESALGNLQQVRNIWGIE